MTILHFCSYYVGSTVFFELFSALNQHCKQFVYVPVRFNQQLSTKQVPSVDFKFVKNLSIFTRAFYLLKLTRILYPAFATYFKNSSIKVVHAHTLYSDGIPAYIFSRLAGRKLIITLRNTDVNTGFKYYRQYKWLAKKALSYSSSIILVSPAHKLKFQNYFGHAFDEKIKVVPNGVNQFYLENAKIRKSTTKDKVVALHVANINKNKNLKNTISAFFDATKELIGAQFRVAGGTYEEYVKVFGELPRELKEKTVFLGKLNKLQLLAEMDEATFFVMVSHHETFGLVYVEAISQCLPIVYTTGQGVDGYFIDGEYGFKADPKCKESISLAVKNTLDRFPDGLNFEKDNPALSFSWDELAKKYVEEIYA
ncbi:glycosyltransferase family 4 protein [Pseudoalteromonas sp. DL2-H2.2]|uniref:glycosyltransferase family 4 protein n=1 Tax=Pseudoalteromonas sp. DL2-H2.2 TaxID=2908889 RepID=UPI001F40B735|nr:glycosyltransferase family 4 protein [Pseudoalteromonas sp. DL2-H2.2]MCF2908846.1 glycosyltransferase family 4 protein [Pseudoalteromonas sp. DL2-H2.2]